MNNNDFFARQRSKLLLSLTILALITRLGNLGYVHKVIFDEVHYGKYISHYLSRQHFFDDHPPLAKLFIAGLAKVYHLNPQTKFEYIGLEYPQDTPVVALRFITALFGALLIPLIFLFTEILTQSSGTAVIASTALLFDNALVVHSRFISPDTFLLFFIFFTIYAYLKSKKVKKINWLIFSGIGAGLAISTKWLGLIGLATVTCMILNHERFKIFSKKIFLYFGIFIIIPFVIYYASIATHLWVLKQPQGFKEFIGLNLSMLYSHSRYLTHGYSSKWFTWPFMIRPVSYLHSAMGAGLVQNLTFLGNPAVWWLSSLGIISLIIISVLTRIQPQRYRNQGQADGIGIILTGYMLSYLPFLSISRCMFLYHYLNAYIFAVIGTSLLLDKFILPSPNQNKEIPGAIPTILTFIPGLGMLILISRALHLWYIPTEMPFLCGVFFIILSLILAFFLYFKARNPYRLSHLWLLAIFLFVLGSFFIFLPLSYGLPIQQKTFDFYMWIRSWI